MNPATYNITIKTGITFGPLNITCKDKKKAAINLSGWRAYAQAHIANNRPGVIDLAPTIFNAAGGIIRIYLSKEFTATLQAGDYLWDLILEDPQGHRQGPYLQGRCRIIDTITKVV